MAGGHIHEGQRGRSWTCGFAAKSTSAVGLGLADGGEHCSATTVHHTNLMHETLPTIPGIIVCDIGALLHAGHIKPVVASGTRSRLALAALVGSGLVGHLQLIIHDSDLTTPNTHPTPSILLPPRPLQSWPVSKILLPFCAIFSRKPGPRDHDSAGERQPSPEPDRCHIPSIYLPDPLRTADIEFYDPFPTRRSQRNSHWAAGSRQLADRSHLRPLIIRPHFTVGLDCLSIDRTYSIA